jgi:hypothetical protein
MCTNQLIHIFRVDKVANLTASVDPVERLTSKCVPEPDTPIGCPSSTTHGAVLVRGPGDGLHSCHVLVELHLWLRVIGTAPYHELVVIASGSKLLLIWAPFESTNLLFVTFKLSKEFLLGSWVSVKDTLISRSTTEERVIPCNATNSSIMALKLAHHLLFDDVPVLKNSTACTDS